MKKLQIIVNPAGLDSVVDILNESGVRHFTVNELKEFGLGAESAIFRGQTYQNRFKTRVAVEAILSAETVPNVVAALRRVVPPALQPEVYVSPVESVDLAASTKSRLAGVGVN